MFLNALYRLAFGDTVIDHRSRLRGFRKVNIAHAKNDNRHKILIEISGGVKEAPRSLIIEIE